MIRTQRDRGQPKLTHHPLATDVDMRWFVTIEAIEEQTIGAWDIRNCGHTIRLEKPWNRRRYDA
jgi:hypothetical protein